MSTELELDWEDIKAILDMLNELNHSGCAFSGQVTFPSLELTVAVKPKSYNVNIDNVRHYVSEVESL